jgi:hypothetical protein
MDEVADRDIVLEPGRLLDTTISSYPGLGPNSLRFLSLTGFLNPRLFQSRLTRLRLTDHPRRINIT